jgi:probable rRNA maturation factor
MISVENRFPTPVDTAALEQAARLTLQNQAAPPDAELAIVLSDDEALHELNLNFREVDASTDVLSFPANEPDPETGAPYLGDIIISVERAQEQAGAAGHALEAELQLLVVHGVLHLLGHDHAEPDEKQKMWSAQDQVLSQLGLPGMRISE